MSDREPVAGSRLRRVHSIASESFDDIEVVFDPGSGIVRRLNRTASEIWRAVAETQEAAEVVANIRARTTGKTLHLEADVLRFVDELIMWGLVESVDS